MSNPQQPERVALVPEDNLPGHHPEHEQDKPEVPPAQRKRRTPPPALKKATERTGESTQTSEPVAAPLRRRFCFEVDPTMAPFARLFGVTADNAWIEVSETEVVAKFGPWVLRTLRSNVAGAQVTGPYEWAKVVGGPRLSLKDRGLTFATTTQEGVCICFRDPVGGVLPVPFLRHPALTVTVEDPEGLQQALRD